MEDVESLRRGEAVFTGTCGGYCHLEGTENGDVPNLFDCQWRHGGSNREVFTTIANGLPDTPMVGFGGKLPEGDDDIWKIVAFLKSRAPNC
jgi:mono/diheme cytochrome c family protein